MLLNVNNFQNMLKKATLNYMVPSVQLVIDRDRVVSKMRNSTNSVIILIDKPNNMLEGVTSPVTLNFEEPNVKVKPYLNLIDSETADAVVTPQKLTLKVGRQRTNLHFCVSSFVTTFGMDEPEPTYFHEMPLTAEFKEQLSKILKVAGSFEKIYFRVINGTVCIETTDMQNRYANGLKFEIGSTSFQNVDICFDYKNIMAIKKIMDDDFSEFTAKFAWLEEQEAGMILFEKSDGSEKFYLLSKLEEQ